MSEEYFDKFIKDLLRKIKIKSVEIDAYHITLSVNWYDVQNIKIVREVKDS